ncbi:L-aspartate oxidase [Janibacter sp. CX7]|uniref:L-aspartate oxidase n=1 Tax=Janibacter sp. CX7 TaxID=2963431 RepID=UPI0020CEEB25|nr:L-aspartate oxidase [Janibacter sp. CX7]UTT65581.1 L-aspartate oxidase [Janibacter sp. CX7]
MPETAGAPAPVVVPRRLGAPEPGWTTQADVLVVGSGIAGLTCALRLREHVDRVLLVTKTRLSEGSTAWAQGGIAAALAPEDSPGEHLDDTLVAGVGLCDEDAVEVLVTEGPARVRELIDLGAQFDRDAAGEITLTREGGHHRDRIAHAGGDATGAEISRALIAQLEAVQADPGIEVIEHALVVDLLTATDGSVCGATVHVIGEGEIDGVGAARARAVVLATGGLGQIYSATTNPSVATGDGMAAALRAGAALADLEFVQFHPTVMHLGEGATGQQPLVSEAVRGEGAVLIDTSGEAFMAGVHPMADLAPRDVVARAILERMEATGTDHVLLDARHLGGDFLERRFPTIVARCRELGIDPATDPIPVAPAQHYASGGVRTDLRGRTNLPGLYACGETSCTGVHGANRLASNSLLEGLVFAHRIAEDLTTRLAAGELPLLEPEDPTTTKGASGLLDAAHRREVQQVMTRGVGPLRSAESTAGALAGLAELAARPTTDAEPGPQTWETSNLLHLGQALATAAHLREETRGGHVRRDHPHHDDETWAAHLLHVRDPHDGELAVIKLDVELAWPQDDELDDRDEEQEGEQ